VENEIFFITAPINSGKTAFIKCLIKVLKKKKIKTGGVYSVKKLKGARRFYRAFDILSGKSVPLLEVEDGVLIASKSGFSFASKAILKAKNCEAAIIDEFGPLEVSGYGYAAAVKKVIRGRNKKVFIVVRKGLVARAAACLKLNKYRVIRVAKNSRRKFISSVLKNIYSLKPSIF